MRWLAILAFALGAILVSPSVWLILFVVSNYSVGFGAGLGWLTAILLLLVLGCALMIWSFQKLRRDTSGVRAALLVGSLLLILVAAIWLLPQFFAVTFIVGGRAS